MKDIELKKLIEGKDLSKAEDIKIVTDAINQEINSQVVKKESGFNEKLDVLKKENESLKANGELSSKQIKELNDKYAEASKTNDFLNKKAWVYKNVNSKLEDEDMNDLFALARSRMDANKDAKFEDVVKEVAKKRGFVKTEITPSPVAKQAVSSETPKSKNKDAVDKDKWNDWFGKK